MATDRSSSPNPALCICESSIAQPHRTGQFPFPCSTRAGFLNAHQQQVLAHFPGCVRLTHHAKPYLTNANSTQVIHLTCRRTALCLRSGNFPRSARADCRRCSRREPLSGRPQRKHRPVWKIYNALATESLEFPTSSAASTTLTTKTWASTGSAARTV